MASMKVSKLLGGGQESSDEEDESDDDNSSVDEESDNEESSSDSDDDGKKNLPKKKGNAFLISDSDASSDNDLDRTAVRSQEERRLEDLRKSCEKIKNASNINDWSTIQTEFDLLNKHLEKYQKLSKSKTKLPTVYVKTLVELEDSLKDIIDNREERKRMNSSNAKALNVMKQRLKKISVQLEAEMKAYRANPVDPNEPSDESGDDEPEEQKKEEQKDSIVDMNPEEVTYEMVNKKLQEVVQARGRRVTDKKEQVDMLIYLAFSLSKGPAQKVEVLCHLVSFLFDTASSLSLHLPVATWKKCVKYMMEILGILESNPQLVLDENFDGAFDRTEEPEEESVKVWGNLVAFVERLDAELFKSLQVIDPHTNEYLSRLQDEVVFIALTQRVSLYIQQTGATEQLPRVVLTEMEHYCYKSETVYNALKAQVEQMKAASPAEPQEAQEEEGKEQAEQVHLTIPENFSLDTDSRTLLNRLVAVIYKHGDERTKARATLMNIFHLSVHDRFFQARDAMLMSHLQDNVHQMDISTQILYNRTLAQLGLASFRKGLMQESYNCLQDLYSSGKVRELLAQGISLSRQQEKTPEQEKQERRRMMPFHLHINLELLEAFHLITAMLLEIPQIAAHPLDHKRKGAAKQFYRYYDEYDKKLYNGPPENVREHVMAASKALLKGNWSAAYKYVSALQCWKLVPNKDAVLEMLKGKLQEEGLRAYLFNYSAHYSALSMDQLCSMFSLPQKRVHSIVSRMMINEDLLGSWDQPTRTVVMHNVQPTRLQSLALQYVDKVANLVDMNERAFAIRSGGYKDNDDEVQDRGDRRGGRDQDHGSYRGRNRAVGPKLGVLSSLSAINSSGGRGSGRGRRIQRGGGGGNFGRQNLTTLGQGGRRQYQQQAYQRRPPQQQSQQ